MSINVLNWRKSRFLLPVVDRHEGGEMWIWDNPSLPVVWRMKNNPLEINWQVEVK